MKRLPFSSLFAAAILLGAFAHAETPAPGAAPAPAAPGAAPATPAATTPAAPGATPAAGAPAKAKPYSSGDVQKIKDFAEALQFNVEMGKVGRSHGKDDKELMDLAVRVSKEATDYFTPLATAAMAHQVQSKDIPSAVSSSDKSAIEKMNKAKADKWKLEYLELFAKESKKNARSVDAAAKAFTDPELKDLATKAAKMLEGQADSLEKMYKDLKSPKKETKK